MGRWVKKEMQALLKSADVQKSKHLVTALTKTGWDKSKRLQRNRKLSKVQTRTELGYTDRITEKKTHTQKQQGANSVTSGTEQDQRTESTGDTGLTRGNRKDRNCKLKHVTQGY